MATHVSGLGVWDWSLSTNCMYWNRNMFDIFELEASEFDHTYSSFERLVHPEDVSLVNGTISSCIEGGKELHFQFRILTRRGAVKYLDAHGKVTVDQKSGEPVRVTGVFIDFSDKVSAERAKVEEHERAEAMKERAHLAEIHREANIRFVGNLCHELRSKSRHLENLERLLLRPKRYFS